MVGFLGALGALGPGLVSGAQKGMDLYDQYTDQQSNVIAGQVLPELGQMGGMSSFAPQMAAGASPLPTPGQPPQAPPQAPQAPPTQVAQAGGMVGAPGEQIMPPSPDPMQAARAELAARMRTAGMAGPAYQPPQVAPQGPMAGAAPPVPAGFQRQAQGTPEQQQTIQASQGTPAEIESWRRSGMQVGWMTPQELATRIEVAAPGASPAAKFKAFQKGMTLLNQSGQTQFNQMMQIESLRMRQQQHEDLQEERRFRREQQDPETIAGKAAARAGATAPIQATRAALQDQTRRLSAIEPQLKKMIAHMDVLTDAAGKVAITGVMPIDTWINNIRAKFGDAEAIRYKTQLEVVRLEVGKVLANPMANAALTEGARKEVHNYMDGVLSPNTLRALKGLFELDARLSKQTTTDEIKRLQKQLQAGGMLQEEPEAPAAPAAGGIPAGVKITPIP